MGAWEPVPTFAAQIHVPHNAVTGILNGQRSTIARLAIRVGLSCGTARRYWQNLKSIFGLRRA